MRISTLYLAILFLVSGCATPVSWPVVQVSGVVGNGSSGGVVIDKHFIAVGESHQGITVEALGTRGATLTFQGKTRFVKVGESTE